jgi:hypothetical protein
VETIQPYSNVEKYCTMLLSDHVETIQPYPNVEKYCTIGAWYNVFLHLGKV